MNILSFLHKLGDVVTDIEKKLNRFVPVTTRSINWKQWIAVFDHKTCGRCKSLHGKIFPIQQRSYPRPPIHENGRCGFSALHAVEAGGATHEGTNGADWWIMHYKILPPYYLSNTEYKALGWSPGKAPASYAPGKMMACGRYLNSNGHLPSAPGRIWFEADINYYQGKRNSQRLLWSDDGLIFVTYDHYQTFIEVK